LFLQRKPTSRQPEKPKPGFAQKTILEILLGFAKDLLGEID
jgi:hypothetical protein